MKFVLAIALLAFATAASAAPQNYAVLVAGSNGYYNYRHQSDICHAFHVLTDKGGIPAENIIVFMYDDIANNAQNPVKGNIINHNNGTNVYPSVNKDYTGAAVTPANFLAVLSGNSSAVNGGSGRVLPSGPEDNVFIYFSDHGATGLVAFPSEYLYATDLMNTLKYMSAHKKYKELVFYIEACEAGSMFAGILPANISIYATTASTPDQSSYACYWDASRQAYLGDEYSVRWMEDADLHDSSDSTWTLEQQFKVVAEETVMSQPQQYGATAIDTEVIENFEGDNNAHRRRLHHLFPLSVSSLTKPTEDRPSLSYTPCGTTAVDSRDIKIKTLLKMRESRERRIGVEKLDRMIADELAHRALADLYMDSILQRVAGDAVEKERLKGMHQAPQDFDCLKSAVTSVESQCGKFSDYSLKYVYQLVNMCEEGYGAEAIGAAASDVCTNGQF